MENSLQWYWVLVALYLILTGCAVPVLRAYETLARRGFAAFLLVGCFLRGVYFAIIACNGDGDAANAMQFAGTALFMPTYTFGLLFWVDVFASLGQSEERGYLRRAVICIGMAFTLIVLVTAPLNLADPNTFVHVDAYMVGSSFGCVAIAVIVLGVAVTTRLDRATPASVTLLVACLFTVMAIANLARSLIVICDETDPRPKWIAVWADTSVGSVGFWFFVEWTPLAVMLYSWSAIKLPDESSMELNGLLN